MGKSYLCFYASLAFLNIVSLSSRYPEKIDILNSWYVVKPYFYQDAEEGFSYPSGELYYPTQNFHLECKVEV